MSEKETNKLIFHTDRSRIVDYRRCHRKRYYGYEISLVDGATDVLGIAPSNVNLPMVVGSSVHQGLEVLHGVHALGSRMDTEGFPDFPVERALEYFNGQVLREEQESLSKLDIADDEFAWMDSAPGMENEGKKREFKIKEARAMVEALVRAYYKVGLPQLLDKYEILMVEKEMSAIICDQEDLEVQLNGRSDAIMRDKETGALVILSIKTAKDLDLRASKNWMEDDQGISECYLVREMARQGLLEEFGIQPFDNIQVGVQMLYLLKGREYQDQNDGIWKHGNAIVRPFAQEQPNGDVELRPKWNWVDETEKARVLGKGWRATPIWETSAGIQDWIDEIELNHTGVLESMVLLPNLYIRTDAEMDNWMTEAALQEMNLATVRLDCQREEVINLPMILAGEFPKNRSSCNYPTACEFRSLCHPVVGELGMSQVGEMLLEGGLVQVEGFRSRRANHVQEEER